MTSRRSRRTLVVAACCLLLVPPLGWAGIAAATWFRFGASRDRSTDSIMDRYAPRYDIGEVHEIAVEAPASTSFETARRVDMRGSGIVRTIFRAREGLLGADAPARPPYYPLISELLALGWGVLEERPGRQIVLGAVTRPWEPNVVFRALPPGQFAAFDSAGYVKIVVTLAADSTGRATSRLRTETRAVATDAASRAKFRRYWSVFSPGILLIRRQILSEIEREAESRVGAAVTPRERLREPELESSAPPRTPPPVRPTAIH